ncbi:MAG: type IX secretion system membrane protein PorP/SprF [Flavobacteriaceae bacterium]|nr:type IX secretion system membrane protein PorP/SprF [Flavobacteriaceae bacterium]
MKKTYKFIGAIALLFSLGASAQQTPEYTFWRQNMSLINPAYVGSTEKTEINIISYKDQFNGVHDGPVTQSLAVQGSFSDKVGIGLELVSDRVFIQKETNVFVNFSYKLSFGEGKDLFLGLKAGGSFFNVDFTRLQTQDQINQGEVSKFNPNFGLGAYYKADKYFVSLSAPRILQAERYEEIAGGVAQEATDATLVMFGGGYYYDLNENIQIIPALMTRYVEGAPFGLDFNVSARFYKKFELGGGYRLNDSMSIMASFEVAEMLDLGFAYDFATSDIKSQTSGGPEFLLRIKL